MRVILLSLLMTSFSASLLSADHSPEPKKEKRKHQFLAVLIVSGGSFLRQQSLLVAGQVRALRWRLIRRTKPILQIKKKIK